MSNMGKSAKKIKNRAKSKADSCVHLEKMSRSEKRDFLSLDLIERMIRIEQRVAASFNKEIPYNKTEYYKSLTSGEKCRFEEYLKKKHRKKFLLGGCLIAFLLALVLINADITGNAIRGFVNDDGLISIVEFGIMIGIFMVCALFFIVLILESRRKRKYDRNFDILEDIYIGKRLVRHFK